MFGSRIGLEAAGGMRRLAAFVERSGFWSGADPVAAEASARLAGGVHAATLIATDHGWVAAAELRPGDRVVTFDNGLQRLCAVGAGLLRSPGSGLPHGARPLLVPAGALGNRRPLTLLPGQSVLVGSAAAEALFGDPFALVPAAALEGWRGIARIDAAAPVEVRFLDFDRDEIVYAEGMALIHCPRQTPVIVASPDAPIAAGSAGHYRTLPPAQGRALIAAMAA